MNYKDSRSVLMTCYRRDTSDMCKHYG